MLVLSRKVGERIRIGSGVTLTVLEVVGSRVRLGIEAPITIPIWRAEVPASNRMLSNSNGRRSDASAELGALAE